MIMATGNATTATLEHFPPKNGWVLYDGECSLCTRAASRFAPILKRHQFDFAPLQAVWVRERLGLKTDEPLAEMKLLTAGGQIYGGVAALVQLARRVWWAWPFFALAQIPGGMTILGAAYRWLAARRDCRGGACRLPMQRKTTGHGPLVFLSVTALLARDLVPAWVFMWWLAGALYFGYKWLTWRQAKRRIGGVDKLLSLGYLFCWVGMDAEIFLQGRRDRSAPKRNEWLAAMANVLAGIFLVWSVTPVIATRQPLAAGWTGMVGLALCLHFGLFQLLALVWQSAGVNAQPIMRQPLRATSLADFWERRWNRAFHHLAKVYWFRPWAQKYGAVPALLGVFLVSGVIHDLLISLPARGGYGLPTAYFLIQGGGILFERSAWGKWLGVGHGWRGWLFAMICTGGPAFWLFHPVFVRNVALPMLRAVGAI